MTPMTEFAISWPSMFGIQPMSGLALLEPKTAKQVVARTSELSAPKSARQMEAVSAPVFFGPVTTRVGSVVFGNVTKRLYHRYFCTTRNW